LIALGRIRSEAHLELVIKLLEDLNINPVADREKGEKIAYGAIQSLEKYRNIAGYSPVFFAASAWYSRRVKDQAIATLPYIVDDPSEAISAIIKSGNYDIKLLGLQKENESKASPTAKSGVALLALSEAWKAATNDVKERITLSRIRKMAIEMLVKYGSSTPEAVPLLERCYKEGIDMEEKLGAVTALSLNKSEEAAQALSSFLLNMNTKRRANDIKQEDERMVRALIPALGAQGSPKGRIALQQVELTDWTNAVKVLAAEALKKLR
jgi:tetratricopeptide (TPR) repeat protein